MSMNQPAYRRPSWAQHEKSYETYTRNDSIIARPSSNSPEFGPETFSYDATYLPQWQLPDGVLKDKTAFPQVLRIELNDWSCAGAALCTALDRIARLKKQAVERGWPRSKTYASLSRSGSASSPASAEARSGTCSPVIASPMMLPVSVTADRFLPTQLTPPSSTESSTNAISGIIPPQPTPRPIDSPPASPMGSSRPANMPNDAKAILPDLSKLPSDLSPRFISGSTTPVATFDENAWETYINSVKAELTDVRSRALPRFKGFGRTIDRLIVEYSNMAEYKSGIASFEKWWITMKPKIAEYEERVKALEVPNLEQVRKERLDQGLPL